MTRDRPRRSGTFFTFALVTAVAGGALAATLLVTDEPPEALRAASTPTEAATQLVEFDDRRSVEVSLAVSDETPLTVSASGVVTALSTSAGGTITSGSSPLEVAGLPLLALHTGVPLHRDLSQGMRGSDVRSLQEELARLGYAVTPDGSYGLGTSRAVRQLKESVGLSRPDSTLALTGVVWLPAESVTTTGWDATLGSTLAAGDPCGTVPGQLTAVTLASAPVSLTPGERTLTLWGHSTTLADPVRATAPEFIAAIASTSDYAGLQGEEEPQHPVATLSLTEPLSALKVPPTALFAIDGDDACIQSGDTPIRVTVLGAALGSTLVGLVGDTAPPPTVRVGPGITAAGCR